ncbi:MAG: hypothetical protein GXP25_22065 [Planctomycetes bacterium]|nr:hypothetical protein [Planctomycetota bacterium]
MRHLALAFFLLSGSLCPAGDLTGKITPPGKCKAIKAVSRMMKLEYEGKINSNTGEYVIKKLPAGKVDLVLTLPEGAINGVDLGLEVYDQDQAPFTEEDKATLTKWIVDNFKLGKEFENKGRPIYFNGNAKHCNVLVEKIRDRAFHAGKNQAVYRVEIWLFDKMYGTWRKRAHAEKVVLRERIPLSEYNRKSYFFDPKLGGIEVKGKGKTTTFDYTIPDKLDASMGKLGTPAGK